MKKISKFLVILLVVIFSFLAVFRVNAYVRVKGYYRKNGTYVRPYVRSNPNGLKTDNYGYRPSQGTYNKTYGTRGSEWDTPTTVTDPEYYEGKFLYEHGLSGNLKQKITCNSGYALFRNHCYKVPVNAHAVQSYTDAWRCNDGFKEKVNYCVKINLSNTTCNSGYTLFRNHCYKVPVNAHAVQSYTDAWRCNDGFKEKENYCIKIDSNKSNINKKYQSSNNNHKTLQIPANGKLNYLGNAWTCKNGYYRYNNGCSKVQIPANGKLNYLGNAWTCKDGYYRYNNGCRLKIK